jgi:hypothetical protein
MSGHIATVVMAVAGGLNLAGCAGYGRHTLRGQVRPDPVTWLLWTLAPCVALKAC